MNESRIAELDRITVLIDKMAQVFGVNWWHAGRRAKDLELITQQDLDDIAELAKQERLARHLRDV